ncbi:hypothetical protein E4T50_10890 [Aureobasidium sp. EXF-12298]|nr:hypothetical protein E4T50_10890 [Aureobasidium sp. EXF-12298]
MFINSTLHGACIAPFYDASLFPPEGGYIGGRLCSQQSQGAGSPLCCLPCPASYWAYSDNFETLGTVAGWLNVAGLALQSFMLISNAFLPAARTRSHYLTQCLIIAVIWINLAFVIPLGAEPDQCYDGITPNDMFTSMTCAWSGAFLLAGALAGSMWIFIRAFSMHLTVVWDIVPGPRFFYISQAVGWGVPAALFAAAISISGVSFRFGNACHINHDNSMVTFWGWLLAVAGAAVIVQMCTFGYCLRVFFNSLWEDSARPSSQASAKSLPMSVMSAKSQRGRVIYRRLKSVLYLQWRGMLIVTIVLVDVIFFAVVFVYLDKLEESMLHDYTRVLPWVVCLIENQGNRDVCFQYSHKWLISEPTIGAMLLMISLLGIELFVLLFRWSLITGWKERWVALTQRGGNNQEFVSLDARKSPFSPEPPTYELRKVGGRLRIDYSDRKSWDPHTVRPTLPNSMLDDMISTPNSPVPVYSPPQQQREEEESEQSEEDISPMTPLDQQRRNTPPMLTRNFSSPRTSMRPVHQERTMGWDPSSTFANSDPQSAFTSRGGRHMTTPSLPPPTEYETRPLSPPGQAL